jgi:pimeloyl-ACP methyl ester carboxylesterase
VAEDVEAVRAALGIEKVDYHGSSYGAVDVRAYAYRYAAHLRVAVLDSPYNSMDETFLRSLRARRPGSRGSSAVARPAALRRTPIPRRHSSG